MLWCLQLKWSKITSASHPPRMKNPHKYSPVNWGQSWKEPERWITVDSPKNSSYCGISFQSHCPTPLTVTHFWAIGVRICFISSMMPSNFSGFASKTFSNVGQTEDWKQKMLWPWVRTANTLILYFRSSSELEYLADLECVSVELLGEHESLGQDGLVVVSVLNYWWRLGVPEHLSDVAFKSRHHFPHLLFTPTGETSVFGSWRHVHQVTFREEHDSSHVFQNNCIMIYWNMEVTYPYIRNFFTMFLAYFDLLNSTMCSRKTNIQVEMMMRDDHFTHLQIHWTDEKTNLWVPRRPPVSAYHCQTE